MSAPDKQLNHAGAADELAPLFEMAARAAAATVARIPATPEALDAEIGDAIAGSTRALLAIPGDQDPRLFSLCRCRPEIVVDPTADQLRDSEVGITGSFAGIARTGTICVSIADDPASAVSLLAPLHIAVLSVSCLVARPRDLFTSPTTAPTALSSDFVFITGPSATADMGPLVRGVHGPHRLHIILLETI